MLSIHPEVQDFGDKDETNYETDEINKEIMNEFRIFIAKIGKYKEYIKIRHANFVQGLSKERLYGSKRRTFFYCKIFVKGKNGVACKPSNLTYFQRSVHRHLKTKGSTVNLQKEDGFKLLKFLERFYNPDESITGSTW